MPLLIVAPGAPTNKVQFVSVQLLALAASDVPNICAGADEGDVMVPIDSRLLMRIACTTPIESTPPAHAPTKATSPTINELHPTLPPALIPGSSTVFGKGSADARMASIDSAKSPRRPPREEGSTIVRASARNG